MLNKNDFLKIAMTGVVAGLVTAASPLLGVQGTEIARGGCGKGSCGADKGKTNIRTSSYESQTTEDPNQMNKPQPTDQSGQK